MSNASKVQKRSHKGQDASDIHVVRVGANAQSNNVDPHPLSGTNSNALMLYSSNATHTKP